MVEVEKGEKERGEDLVGKRKGGREEGGTSAETPDDWLEGGSCLICILHALTLAPMYSISYVYFSAFAKTVAVGTVILCMLRKNIQEYQKMIRGGLYMCMPHCVYLT